MNIIFDVMEFTAVFFLAVEAIKLDNLSILVKGYLSPLLKKLNPEITFVTDDSHLSFRERHEISFILLLFCIIGFTLIYISLYKFNINTFELISRGTTASTLLNVLFLIFCSLVVGFLPLQLSVWMLEYSIRLFSWIQLKTHTGVVGILGFVIFAIQFWGRRVFVS